MTGKCNGTQSVNMDKKRESLLMVDLVKSSQLYINEETIGKTKEDTVKKRKLKEVQAKLRYIIESNQDMDVDNLDLLNVPEEDYQKMNVHQVETLLYCAKILAKAIEGKEKS